MAKLINANNPFQANSEFIGYEIKTGEGNTISEIDASLVVYGTAKPSDTDLTQISFMDIENNIYVYDVNRKTVGGDNYYRFHNVISGDRVYLLNNTIANVAAMRASEINVGDVIYEYNEQDDQMEEMVYQYNDGNEDIEAPVTVSVSDMRMVDNYFAEKIPDDYEGEFQDYIAGAFICYFWNEDLNSPEEIYAKYAQSDSPNAGLIYFSCSVDEQEDPETGDTIQVENIDYRGYNHNNFRVFSTNVTLTVTEDEGASWQVPENTIVQIGSWDFDISTQYTEAYVYFSGLNKYGEYGTLSYWDPDEGMWLNPAVVNLGTFDPEDQTTYSNWNNYSRIRAIRYEDEPVNFTAEWSVTKNEWEDIPNIDGSVRIGTLNVPRGMFMRFSQSVYITRI